MLTKEEQAWLNKIQKLLNKPPSNRLGFFTNGDCDVAVYDRTLDAEIQESHDADGGEYSSAVDRCDARLGELMFPSQVHSVAG